VDIQGSFADTKGSVRDIGGSFSDLLGPFADVYVSFAKENGRIGLFCERDLSEKTYQISRRACKTA